MSDRLPRLSDLLRARTDRRGFLARTAAATLFELVADVPGTFPFVNHAFGHGQKGAIGALVVE